MKNYPFIFSEIENLPPYVPGKPIEEVQEEFGLKHVIKMASNENPLGPSPQAIAAIAQATGNLALYPDADARNLKKDLSEQCDHPAQGFIIGNGSSDFIQLLARVFLRPGHTAIMSKPSFTLYAANVTVAGATALEVPLKKDYQHDLEAIITLAHRQKARLIYLDNPSNPTGSYLNGAEVESLAARLPEDCILVLDEAYIEFAREKRPDYIKLLGPGSRVIVMRTFSKVYGLAGLRLGYALAAPELAQIINKARQPFNTSSLAQVAARVALKDREHLEKVIANNQEGLNYLTKEVEKLGLTPYPSQANFFMVNVKTKASQVFENLLKLGFIIRPLGSFGLFEHIRITPSVPADNRAFIEALKKTV